MKVKKNGTVSLERDEVRIGNFFVKVEKDHIKIQDLNSMFTHRIRKHMAISTWIENMLEAGDGGKKSLETYVTVMWSVFSPAPDEEYMTDLVNAATATLQRHPEWYGMKKNPTEKDDEEALRAVKEMKEFEDEIKEKMKDEKTKKSSSKK